MKNKFFPLKNFSSPIPEGSHPGSFGVVRKHDIHTGVDLYCEPMSEVVAIEDGTVLDVINFTGSVAGSPWWNETMAVLIKGESGIILYGEILPDSNIKKGVLILAGQSIGKVITVLKIDKNKPMTMLHLELYNQEIKDAVVWQLSQIKPEALEDPTDLLKKIKT